MNIIISHIKHVSILQVADTKTSASVHHADFLFFSAFFFSYANCESFQGEEKGGRDRRSVGRSTGSSAEKAQLFLIRQIRLSISNQTTNLDIIADLI